MEPLAIRKSLSGRHILLTGASGFLGKFWLVQALDQLPEIERIYILVRPKSGVSGRERFADLVNHSPIFTPLHEKHGAKLSQFISERVEVIEGQLQNQNFGIEGEALQRLRQKLDIVINCAGLTDFNPDIRLSLLTNVDGAINAAGFVRSCDHASLFHVSTCYVVGKHQGRIKEAVEISGTALDSSYDPDQEYEFIQGAIGELCQSKEFSAKLEGKRARIREMRLRRRLIDLGEKRAAHWGWPNIYTYCKAMAERKLVRHFGDLNYAIFRPAIIESSINYPFPGWNEGVDGSGPLAYLLGTWFRDFPARPGNPFDIIPVDFVSNAMIIVAASLLSGCQRQVYHCGTSDRNRLTIDRGCELTALAHRRYYRKHGESWLERLVLSRWEAIAVEEKTMTSLDKLRQAAKSMSSVLRSPPSWLANSVQDKSKELGHSFEKIDRKLKPIEKMIEAYRPFTLENRWIFETKSLSETPVLEEEFRFEPEKLCWRDWWINIHIPALRKWCFPRIEGRTPERYKPAHRFEWLDILSSEKASLMQRKVG
jgi:nucleoside-diphosphate-sugar epimerase